MTEREHIEELHQKYLSGLTRSWGRDGAVRSSAQPRCYNHRTVIPLGFSHKKISQQLA